MSLLRIHLLIIIITFSYGQSLAQDDLNFNFFETHTYIDGVHYSKALIQARVDSVEVLPNKSLKRISKIVEKTDTFELIGFRVLKDTSQYKLINDYTDTSSASFLSSEINAFLGVGDCIDQYETQMSNILLCIKCDVWEISRNNDILNSQNWKIRQEDIFHKSKSVVLTRPCRVREIPLPQPRVQFIKIIPKRVLTKSEKSKYQSATDSIIIYQYLDLETQISTSKNEKKANYNYSLSETARIDLIPVYSENEIAIFLPELKENLNKQNYLIDLDKPESLKKAIIKYQLEFDLPIGQYDKETIDLILNLY